MKRYLLLLLFLMISLYAIGQKIPLSLEGGFNDTDLNISSKYTRTGDGAYSLPYQGYFIGLAGKYSLNENTALKIFVQGEKRSVRQSLTFVDANNQPLGGGMSTTSNNYLNIGVLYVLRPDKVFQIGIGINNHLLIYSTTMSTYLKYQQINGKTIKSTHVRNYYFKPYNVSVPIQISLNGKRVYGFLTTDIGIFSRIRHDQSYLRQVEYSIQLGIGYKFKAE
jgi:hypothetical protein